ncbi:hypothetical protein [Mucilaginibacter sp. FT3.2]|uniref:hypothetical protein n=1 Tax=Mucilaginibacter sp. FT3.2 TaxID=2723090 RepID=UPI00161CFD8B|nr:hypothetical protein [Mucilaginibacter sp. FT3.2]MBB6235183.1 hypothetical protein [Mucilaginibacter sp. FT3.2]
MKLTAGIAYRIPCMRATRQEPCGSEKIPAQATGIAIHGTAITKLIIHLITPMNHPKNRALNN